MYLKDPGQIVFFPNGPQALEKLQNSGFKLFLVTNQSGVGRGFFTLEDVDRVHARLASELARHGVKFEKVYVAPEHPDRPSRGRKPSPEFLFDARDEFNLDLAQSYMIGDKLIDLECGWNAGVKKSILVRTGYGKEVERRDAKKIGDAMIVNTLRHAADWILER